jgi:hypothetical protein
VRSLDPSVVAALASGNFSVRDTVYLEGKNIVGPGTATFAWWNGNEPRDISVSTAAGNVVRTYQAAGALSAVSSIQLTTSFEVQAVELSFRGQTLEAETSPDEMIRTFNMTRGIVEIHRAFFDPLTDIQIGSAPIRFKGFVDEDNTTANAGDEGETTIVLTIADPLQELTKSFSYKRSDADQRRRGPNDAFFKSVAGIAEKNIRWGG